MSVQSAINFIQRVEKDEKLKGKIRGLVNSKGLEEVVNVGSEAGFKFTAEELEVAFVKDWEIRWNFYSSKILK